MRSRILLLCLLSLGSLSARASWQTLSNNGAYTADFFNSHLGLIVFNDGSVGGQPILRWDGTNFTGVFSDGTATQIVIQDSDRAWAFVPEIGIFFGTKNWTSWKQSSDTLPSTPHFVAATPSGLFFYMLGDLYCTSNGDSAIKASGILHGDSIIALDYLSDLILVAQSQYTIYRSTDGGMTWTNALELRASPNSIFASVFADRAHSWIYTGGDSIRKSIDSGKTWSAIIPPQELDVVSLSGQVFGSHDCAGIFYIAYIADVSKPEIFRSRDGGVSIEDAGPVPYTIIQRSKFWSFDRGSTAFFLDQFSLYNGYLYVSHNGIDGLISDSVGANISISAETIYDTICAGPQKSFNITVSSSICTPIEIDSIGVVKSAGKITRSIVPIVISGDSAVFSLAYSGIADGTDSIMLRLWFHGLDDEIEENSYFPVIAFSSSPPAVLASTDSLQFGDVQLLKTKTLTIEIANAGCSRLVVDSVVSSNPTLFGLPKPHYSFSIGADSTAKINVTFMPAAAGEAIESIELGTGAGHKFIELVGTGVTQPISFVENSESPTVEIFPNPASDILNIRNALAGSKYEIRDLLGRIITSGILESGEDEISTASLCDGIYIFQADGDHPTRIIISRK